MSRLVLAAAIIAVGVALPPATIEPTGRAGTLTASVRRPGTAGPSVTITPPTATRAQGNRPQQPDLIAVGGTPSGHIGTILLGGRASWVRASLGPRYLALRLPRGTLTRICGKACVLRVTTDYGPSSRIRPRRVADLSAADFRVVCGPLSMGTCKVSVELLESISLPATDTAQ